ncbi:MAG: AAA family ATPase [Candidatus Kapaibacterium sp.]
MHSPTLSSMEDFGCHTLNCHRNHAKWQLCCHNALQNGIRVAIRPELLREYVAAVPDGGTVVIDEIQKLAVLLEVVHAIIGEGQRKRFVLTGSSARKLRKGNVNFLGGRAAQVQMHPYIGAELGADFSLEQAINVGLVPLVVESTSPEETLQAYASLCIQQEVLAKGLTRSDEQFSRFLEAISFSHGEVLDGWYHYRNARAIITLLTSRRWWKTATTNTCVLSIR